jgi:hypothetical protein
MEGRLLFRGPFCIFRTSGIQEVNANTRSRCTKKAASLGCATNVLQSAASCNKLCYYELLWLHLSAHSSVTERRTVGIWHKQLEPEYVQH